MIGFFRRHAAVLIAVALASGLAPSISHGADRFKQVCAARISATRGYASLLRLQLAGSAATSRGGTSPQSPRKPSRTRTDLARYCVKAIGLRSARWRFWGSCRWVAGTS